MTDKTRIEGLILRSTPDFRAARGDPARERFALLSYFHRGRAAGLGNVELMDGLTGDKDSALERAGYAPEDVRRVCGLMSTFTDDDIDRVNISPR